MCLFRRGGPAAGGACLPTATQLLSPLPRGTTGGSLRASLGLPRPHSLQARNPGLNPHIGLYNFRLPFHQFISVYPCLPKLPLINLGYWAIGI